MALGHHRTFEMASSGAMNHREDLDDYSDFSSDEYAQLNDEVYAVNQRTAQETKGWNVFRELPVKQESGSTERVGWVEVSVKLLKLLAYLVTFALVLGAAVVAKGTLLFMAAQTKKDRQVVHCNRLLGLDQQFVTYLPLEERVVWLWGVLIAFSVPELATFFRSARICFFKTASKPKSAQLLLVLLIETLHTIGVAMMLLFILPELDSVKGAMIANCVCFVPGLLNALSRNTYESRYTAKVALDVLALLAQLTGFFVWPVKKDTAASLWLIPVSCALISLTWWENYVDKRSRNGVIRVLARLKEEIKQHRYYTHRLVAPWKIFVFMVLIPISLWINGDDPWSFFNLIPQAFDNRNYVVNEVQIVIEDLQAGLIDTIKTESTFELPISWATPIWVTLIQVMAAYICFVCAKYACKILIQGFSFALALSLVVPVSINILIVLCGMRNENPCAFHWTIPDYLFFNIPPMYFLNEYLAKDLAWLWLLWLLSQMWISVHVWMPKCERLAVTEKLFALPQYNGVLVDQSLLLNRSKDEEIDLKFQDLKDTENATNDDLYETMSNNSSGNGSMYKSDVKSTDYITRIYCCATMWHETKDEMIEFLKSIFRLDEDQCARRVAQKYLRVVDPDYYELEPHIFMDDSFEVSDHSSEDSQVNRFVKLLVETIDEAASEVHLTNVRLRPPKKYPTPYGGRLVWTLPGKNKLVCHLKDKSKIRHRKRWSQVMYMYYFLGHRLMDLPISVDRKEVIAENTYLLALDGDIDFQPKAVTLLIDLMKKNKNLGAACGRIHPIGSGPMVWYQMFEYAIGHWLQKATEHMIGCVLCSPGCFSLFRGKALMDDNVMRKYTLNSSEARHYVQYDQGEDRWLCTLMLQRGYRVEYSAASDSYTHCPEGFNEFFNQRRRWVPSTMANILDLLADAKRTISVNDNISRVYIIYQLMLMAGTVLGPGTIFLMLVGALNAAFGVSNWTALQINLIPVGLFLVICMTCKSEIQLFFAGVITCFYGMLMMAVFLGIALQIVEDGWLAPSSVFFVATLSVFFITAALHPQELNCLFYILVYYITIPSMYMLLIIYSLCNMNNVTWGTREVAQKKTAKEIENEKIEMEEAKKNVEKKSFLGRLQGRGSDETSGTIEVGVSGLFKCLCCTNPKDHKDDMHLVQIASSLEKLETKLASYHQMALGGEPLIDVNNTRRKTSIGMRGDILTMLPEYPESEGSSDIPREERDELSNPYWIEDPNLQKGEVDFLTTAEIQFWKDLIDAYLRPIDENKEEQERIKKDLKDLRDKMVFGFVMLNAIFVLVIFLLQMNQDVLHINWPFGQNVELSYDNESNTIHLEREYLRLEPIGSVFLIFFGVVMCVQFIAMIFHRFGTLTHLLATVQLNWYFTKRPTELSQNALLQQQAVDIVRDMQKLNTAEAAGGASNDHVGRRQTVHNLERARQSKPNMGNLDATFKKRFFNMNADEESKVSLSNMKPSLRRLTLKALETRRDSLVAERRRSQAQGAGGAGVGVASGAVFQYNKPRTTVNNLAGGNGRASAKAYMRPSMHGQRNLGYAPAIDSESDDEIAPMPNVAGPSQPRKSQVTFKDYNC